MADPHWTSYVGMATGIAGAIMGYVSYRRSNRIKSLDLRLELRKAINEVEISLSQLGELLEYANKSHKAVASATGSFHSGMMVKWKEEVKADKIKIEQLSARAPKPEENYEKLNPKELESKLVDIHKLQGYLKELRAKYDAAVRSDDENRKQIREDIRVRHAPQNQNT